MDRDVRVFLKLPITLKRGRLHVIKTTLSKTAYDKAVISGIAELYVDFEK